MPRTRRERAPNSESLSERPCALGARYSNTTIDAWYVLTCCGMNLTERGPTICTIVCALLVALVTGCGARTELDWEPDQSTFDGAVRDGAAESAIPPFATCVEMQTARVGEWVTLTAALSTGAAVQRGGWGVTNGPADGELVETSLTTARFRATKPGRYEVAFGGRTTTADTVVCITTVIVRADIRLACASDPDPAWRVSALLGETISLDPLASSETGRGLSFRWQIVQRQAGSSSELESADRPTTRLRLDQVGQWSVRLNVANDLGEEAGCLYLVSSSPDLAVRCPDRVRARVGEFAQLVPLEVRNRLAQPLRSAWEISTTFPIGTNSVIEPVSEFRARLFVDVAEQWVVRFGVYGPGGTEARCTSRVEGVIDDDVRIELLWDQGFQSAGPHHIAGVGQRLSLHASLEDASSERFPSPSGCSDGRCLCRDEVESQCASAGVDWAPAGAPNNAYLRAPADCSHAGPYMLVIPRAQPESTFEIGATFDEVCNPEQLRFPVAAAGAFIRVYCGGALSYMSEYVPLRDPRALREPDAWSIGTITFHADRTCSVRRRCVPGVAQERCVGPRSREFAR